MITRLRSNDFACPSCVTGLEKMIQAIEGVEDAAVHFMSGRILIRHDPSRVATEDLIRAIRKAGYVARPTNLE